MNVDKRVVDCITNYSEDSLIRKIKKRKYVSFDIFDTCVKRTVPRPTDVFWLSARKLSEKGIGSTIDENCFLEDRCRAAQTASGKRKSSEEITIDEIYECLPKGYASIREALKAVEIECHIKVCVANPVIKRVFEWCKRNGKVVVFTSDMFLDLSTIETILHECGYEGYAKLFLSSDIGLKKSTGSLFRYVVSELKAQPGELIHIGDSIKADYISARKAGLDAILIATNPNRTKYGGHYILSANEQAVYDDMKTVMDGIIDPKWSDFFRYGFEAIGPLIYGFVIWLQKKAKQENIERLYFMARDGYLLKRAFESVDSDVKCTYLEVSRRSLGIPLMRGKDGLETLVCLNDLNKQWNCKMLCYRLGVDYIEWLPVWKEKGLEEETTIRGFDLLKDQRVINFYNSVCNKIVKGVEAQYNLLAQYLKNVGFNDHSTVVDTGGNCTSQKYLNRFLETKTIRGYYLWKRKAASDLIAESFPIDEAELSFGNMSIVEYFLTAHEGTTLYYREKALQIEAVHREYEHDEKTIQLINEVQEGILYFIRMFYYSYGGELWPANVYKNNIVRTSQRPTLSMATMFGELYSYNDETIEKISPTKGMGYYCLRPKKFLSDLKKVGWKTGFLKRTLILPVNYSFILRQIKSRQN